MPLRLVTVDADAAAPGQGVVTQEIAALGAGAPVLPPQPVAHMPNTLNQFGSDWHAAPISPGGTLSMAGVEPAQPRDSGWRMDQRELGHRRAQQERQRAELQAQIEEKRQRDEARKREVKEREAREDAEAASYNPWGRAGGGAPLVDIAGNVQTDLRVYKASSPSAQPNSAPRWPPPQEPQYKPPMQQPPMPMPAPPPPLGVTSS